MSPQKGAFWCSS